MVMEDLAVRLGARYVLTPVPDGLLLQKVEMQVV